MTEQTAGASTTPGTGSTELTHRQILTILGGLMLGMFLAALDQTIMATATRTIAAALINAETRSPPTEGRRFFMRRV